MEDFDPASLGAVAVDDYKQNTFDPSSLGAVAVEEFDPRSLGAEEVSESQGAGDMLRRIPAGIASATAQAAAGLAEIAEYSPLNALARKIIPGAEERQQETKQFIRGVGERADTDYGVDPKYNEKFVSKVISGIGSVVPIIAAGPLGGIGTIGTGAALAGESARAEAEQMGATEGEQEATFLTNAAVGAITEKLMGLPALMKSVKATGADKAARSFATRIATQTIKEFGREGSQETLQQIAQDTAAKYIYDPDRKVFEAPKLLETFAVGGVIGAGMGAVAQAAEGRDPIAQAVENELSITAESAPPPPITPESIPVPETTPKSTDVATLPSGSTIVMEPQEIPAVEPTVEPAPVEEITVEPTEVTPTEIPSETIPSEVPQQQESQTPQEPPKVLTPDERARTLQPFVKEAERVAESMGATDPEQAASKAWADLSKSDLPLDNPRSLLLKFATGNAKDQLKASQAKSRGAGNVVSMEGQDIENAAVETEGPRAKMLQKEDLEQIRKAIDTFTPTEKRVGTMLMDEMTVEEIAEELEMAVGSVKNIRTRLAQELGPYAKRMGLGKPTPPGAASAEEELVKYAFSKFSERVQKSDPELYERMENVYYEPIPMHVNEKRAMELVEKNGPDAVANQVQDLGNELTFADRSTAALAIVGFWKRQADLNRETNPVLANQLLDKAADLASWARAYGTSLGQGVNAFKAWGKNLKLAKMIALMQEANGGVPLTNDQRDFINEIDKDETETEERLDARITALEEEASQSHADLTLSDRIKENIQEKTDPLVLSIAERIGKWLKTKEDAARKRLRERVKYLGSNPDPLIAADLAIIGASKLYNGILSKVKWMQAMRADEDLSGMGEELEQYLEPAWEDANKLLDDKVEDEAPKAKREPVKRIVKKMTGEEVREELTKRITKEAKEGGKLEDMVPLIRRLADSFIASGIRTRDPLVDALHAVIEPILPGTTKREVRDAFSGYGRFREPAQDEVSKIRRDVAAQLQVQSKYEDVLAGRPLLPTGLRRDPTSDEVRRLNKLLEEAKRVHGVKVTDPARQLKSAQDAIKTRLKNEIKDMARQIETGEKPPGKSQTEWDAEIEALKAQRDRMKDVLSSLEDTKIPEETRVKNAERALEKSIEEIQRRIKNKETKTAKGTPLESEKLSVLRAQKEVLLAELDELRSADTALQEEKAFDALMNRKDRLEKQIASGDLFPATKEKPEDTELVKEAREMVNELQKQLADARRSSPESRKVQLDKAIASVESSIKALDARLQAGDLSTKESSPEVTTPELERLRAERAAMVKELNRQRREAAKPSESEAQAKKDAKQIENLEKSIAALTQKINAKDLSTKPRRPLSTPEAQKLADYKKYLNDFLNDMRRAAKPKLTAEEVAMKAFKTRTARKTAELERKIAAGDFTRRKPKEVNVSLDAEARAAKAKLHELEEKFAEGVEKTRIKNLNLLGKGAHYIGEGLEGAKSSVGSADLSAFGRQGLPAVLAHPIMGVRNLGQSILAMNERKLRDVNAKLSLRKNNENGKYKKMGISLSGIPGGKKEEMFKSKWASKFFPHVRWSERQFNTFLNLMRADIADRLIAANPTATDEQLKAFGFLVNVATGRGDIGKLNNMADAASKIMWAPKLYASRIQGLIGQPIWNQDAKGVRTKILKEYVRAGLTASAIVIAFMMAGADVEKDPASSDFFKFRFGKLRHDPWGGHQQWAVFLNRMITGNYTTTKGEKFDMAYEDKRPGPYDPDYGSVLTRMFRSKLNPTWNLGWELRTGKDIHDKPVSPAKAVVKSVIPMSTFNDDILPIYREYGINRATALQIENLLGFGVSHYGEDDISDSKKKQQRALEIMASPR